MICFRNSRLPLLFSVKVEPVVPVIMVIISVIIVIIITAVIPVPMIFPVLIGFEDLTAQHVHIEIIFNAVAVELDVPDLASVVPVLMGSGKRNLVFLDRKSTRLNSSHDRQSRMPSSA